MGPFQLMRRVVKGEGIGSECIEIFYEPVKLSTLILRLVLMKGNRTRRMKWKGRGDVK